MLKPGEAEERKIYRFGEFALGDAYPATRERGQRTGAESSALQ